jgi:uncharacterized protein YegL
MKKCKGSKTALKPNQEVRISVCFCIDTSGLVEKKSKHLLMDAVNCVREMILSDEMFTKSCDLCLVTYGGTAKVLSPFHPIGDKKISQFVFGGDTSLASGVELALKSIDSKQQEYKSLGIKRFCPWLVIFAASPSSENLRAVQDEVLLRQKNKKLVLRTFVFTEQVKKSSLASLSLEESLLIDETVLDYLEKLKLDEPSDLKSEGPPNDGIGPNDWGEI